MNDDTGEKYQIRERIQKYDDTDQSHQIKFR